jgi:uncharacterized protein (TIGR02001 family)
MKLQGRRVAAPVVLAVLSLQGTVRPCLADGGWSGQIAATSDYVLRGVSQTDEQPAIQGSVTYDSRVGAYAGVWISSLDASDWYYPAGTASVETDLFAGYRRTIGSVWGVGLRFTRYLYPNDGEVVDYDYSELEASLEYRDIVRVSVAWSPDTSLVTREGLIVDRDTRAAEVATRWPLWSWLSITAGLGYRDLAGLETGGYGYWSIGVTGQRGPFSVDLAQIGTDSDGLHLFGSDLAGSRTVLSLGWTF